MTAAGIFITHRRTPRIRRHYRRLVAETRGLVRWHFVFSHDTGARPTAPFATGDPAEVLAHRYRAMERHGGVQGGYLDTLILPLLRALPAEHLWVMEYDVDYAGRWDALFQRYVDTDADLLTTNLRRPCDQPDWPWWSSARSPSWVPESDWVRSLNPLMRLSRRLVNAYCVAMSDAGWEGHYEFTLPTAARASGCVIEDLGGDGPFTPDERRGEVYVGSASDWSEGQTFGFRPVRRRYFHERPEAFHRRDLLYHPVKPGVPAWTRATMNVREPG